MVIELIFRRHGFNVTQTMFAVLTTGGLQNFFQDLTIFGLLVAALCHDLGKIFELEKHTINDIIFKIFLILLFMLLVLLLKIFNILRINYFQFLIK